MSFYYENDGASHALKMMNLQHRALSGDASSQYEYGQFLIYDAEGGPKEKLVAEGIRWLKMSADKGCCDAIELLGSVYLNGNLPGVERDQEEGMRLTWIAAEMGSGGVVDTLAYHFAYDSPPDLVKGYAYFRLREYVASQTGYSTEIALENLSGLRPGMSEIQVAQADELFVKLRDELESKPYWRTTRASTKKKNDKDRYTWLMDRHGEASQYADSYPDDLARIKGYIDGLEVVMDRDDMITIRDHRAKAGRPNSPETPLNKPRIFGGGCLGLIASAFLLGGGLCCLLVLRF
jgi:hypothetical protein